MCIFNVSIDFWLNIFIEGSGVIPCFLPFIVYYVFYGITSVAQFPLNEDIMLGALSTLYC